jgi:phytoene/squalene synthetase
VASWLCPPHLRAPIAAIYAFARTADDIADEGDANAAQRLADLAAYRADLHAVAGASALGALVRAVFAPLAAMLQSHALPVPLLDDLLSAFIQDVEKTRDAPATPTAPSCWTTAAARPTPWAGCCCTCTACDGAQALDESDAICTALQLINFWQDLSVDLPRARFYLPDADCAAHGVDRAQLLALAAPRRRPRP